jgi:acetolactate synthase I/II/III large subunit
MVRDGGATTIFGWTYSQAKPHDVLWNQNFGHLGTGLPYAIGASVADGRKRPVMLITGDSSFLFHLPELETAARLNVPLVCVVAVDYAWGLEVGVYKRTFGPGSRETGVHWSTSTRLDKVAEGFGCHGEYAERDEDIARYQARVRQRQARRGPRGRRPEGQLGGDAQLRRIPHLVRRRDAVIMVT